jgi:hypothetical protein
MVITKIGLSALTPLYIHGTPFPINILLTYVMLLALKLI